MIARRLPLETNKTQKKTYESTVNTIKFEDGLSRFCVKSICTSTLKLRQFSSFHKHIFADRLDRLLTP